MVASGSSGGNASSNNVVFTIGRGETLNILLDGLQVSHWGAALILVDGGWSEWSFPGPCSVTCDRGQRVSYRTCTNPAPINGGASCRGSPYRSEVCRVDNYCYFSKKKSIAQYACTQARHVVFRKEKTTSAIGITGRGEVAHRQQ